MSKKKAKNYEYQGNKDVKKTVPDKKVRNILFGVGAVLIVLFVVLVCIEPTFKNKLVINNRSSHKITSLRIWYEDSAGNLSNAMEFENVDSKEKIKDSTDALELTKLAGEAWITLQIEFEDGGEALLQTGHFLSGFEGKISFEVSDTKTEELKLHVQAGEGLFNSTAVTNCDDIYYINPENGYIE